MTVQEPDDEGMRQMIDGLDLAEPDPSTLVAALSDADLVSRYTEVQHKLADRGALVNPSTDEDRELHSQHSACFLELKKRGLR